MAIKVTSALFTNCITAKEGLPDDGLPVIALVGRSNVGKSSLINTLANRRELARTSSLPGKTLTINFYNFNDQFYLVDLPGYGYAKASKVTRQRIQVMMNEFFVECKSLKAVVQILDSRHKPSSLDIQMYDWLRDQKFNYIAVLTKIDKLGNQNLAKMKKTILKDMGLNLALTFSAQTSAGKEEILDAIEKILAGYQFKSADPRARTGERQKHSEKTRPSQPKEKTTQGSDNAKPAKDVPGNCNENKKTDKKQPGSEKRHENRPEGQTEKSAPGQKTDENKNAGNRRRRRRPRRPGGAPGNGNENKNPNRNESPKPDSGGVK